MASVHRRSKMHMTRHEPTALPSSELALRAICGERLANEERSRLSPALLTLLTAGGHLELTEVERYRLPKFTLLLLAAAGVITLSRRERDRLNPARLAQLVVGGHTLIEPDEFKRLPRWLRE